MFTAFPLIVSLVLTMLKHRCDEMNNKVVEALLRWRRMHIPVNEKIGAFTTDARPDFG